MQPIRGLRDKLLGQEAAPGAPAPSLTASPSRPLAAPRGGTAPRSPARRLVPAPGVPRSPSLGQGLAGPTPAARARLPVSPPLSGRPSWHTGLERLLSLRSRSRRVSSVSTGSIELTRPRCTRLLVSERPGLRDKGAARGGRRRPGDPGPPGGRRGS